MARCVRHHHALWADASGSAYLFGGFGWAEKPSDVPACQQYSLPAREFHGVWESLVFDTAVKDELLSYSQTAMIFADRGVDTNLVAFNRVILLHGPPGTVSTHATQVATSKSEKEKTSGDAHQGWKKL